MGATNEDTADLLAQKGDILTEKLEAPFDGKTPGHHFASTFPCDFKNETSFDQIADWLHDRVLHYESVVNELYA